MHTFKYIYTMKTGRFSQWFANELGDRKRDQHHSRRILFTQAESVDWNQMYNQCAALPLYMKTRLSLLAGCSYDRGSGDRSVGGT